MTGHAEAEVDCNGLALDVHFFRKEQATKISSARRIPGRDKRSRIHRSAERGREAQPDSAQPQEQGEASREDAPSEAKAQEAVAKLSRAPL